MSFTPLSGQLSTALVGSIEPSKFIDVRESSRELSERRIHGKSNDKSDSLKYNIIIVIISAIIFVTVIALYDIVRTGLNVYYSNLALNDPNSHNIQEDIDRTTIANFNALMSSITFAAICLFIGIILILFLIYFLR